jgi:hypothetical protein
LRRFAAKICQTVEQTVKIPQQTISESAVGVWAEIASSQRTLRIPDDGKIYPLPAGFGRFPLRHVDDYKDTVPAPWTERGGVLMPMYQSEALWIRFSTRYPFAVKVAAGKINAVTGDPWSRDLQADPQD